MHAPTLITQLQAASWALARNVEGVDEIAALKPAPNSAASVNWVVGHVTAVRNTMVWMITQKAPYPRDEFAAYFNPQAPLPADQAVSLEELRSRYDTLSELLFAALRSVTPEMAEQPAPFSPTRRDDETIGSLLTTLAFHEAYHVGQLGILRRILGLGPAIQPAPR